MNQEFFDSDNVEDCRNGQTSDGAVETEPVEVVRSASMLPLIVLYQRAVELAYSTELSLGRLEHAAEATALAEAIRHLLADAGDEEGYARWVVRVSEARHWCAAIHDALTCREENEP